MNITWVYLKILYLGARKREMPNMKYVSRLWEVAILGGLVYKYRYPMSRTTSEQKSSSIYILCLNDWMILCTGHILSATYYYTLHLPVYPSCYCGNHLLAGASWQYMLLATAVFCLLPRDFLLQPCGTPIISWDVCKPRKVRDLTLKERLWAIEGG